MCDNSSDVVEEFYKDGKVLRIMLDIDPVNPRDPKTQDNLATILFVSPHHKLGDDRHGLTHSEFASWDDFYRYIFKSVGAIWARPVVYTDGQMVLETWPICQFGWNTHSVGIIYVTEERIQELCGSGEEYRAYDFVMKAFETELWEYNQYLQGDVYGYEVVEIDRCPTCDHIRSEKQLDSSWGFYGTDWKKNGLFESAGWTVETKQQQDNNEAIKA